MSDPNDPTRANEPVDPTRANEPVPDATAHERVAHERTASGEPPGGPNDTNRTPWLVAAAALAIVVIVAVILLLAADDDDDTDVAADEATTTTIDETTTTLEETTTTEATTTTTAPEETTTTLGSELSEAERATVVWPPVEGDERYDAPVAVAEAFATELIGFDDPVVGEFMAGDAGSGEVEVRNAADGPANTVLVRQYGDSWWVLGALSENIELAEPASGDEISDPVTVSGRSRAFEGVVQVSVYAAGSTEPIGEGIVMGGAGPDMAPFSGEISFDEPGTGHGIVVLHTESARDGSVRDVVAVPVTFADA